MTSLSNIPYDEIEVGRAVSVSRVISRFDLEALAFVSGDIDATQLGEADEAAEPGAEPVAAEAFFSYLLNRLLPGPGTFIVSHQLEFRGRLRLGDKVTATVTARDKLPDGQRIVFDCRCSDGSGEVLASGTATVIAPARRITYTDIATPEVIFRRCDRLGRLMKSCEGRPAVTCGVVYPCDRDALLGPLEAARRGWIAPVLIGPEARIRQAAATAGVELAGCTLVDAANEREAALRAVELARGGQLQALMKGSLHTDELMAAVVPSATGLRTSRRISHAFVLDVPAYPRLLLVTDAAINVAPGLKEKADIAQNAIDLAHVLGIECPKVAILAAVETIHPDMPATLDAAALCKMAERRQITGGVLDGPLAFDNAVDERAARTKKIDSPVAGQADILLVPDLEAGNMVAKQLQYLAGADAAGIVLGTRVPIVLTSRADSVRTRLASVAVMTLLATSAHESTRSITGQGSQT